MNFKKLCKSALLVTGILASSAASATVILSTDFDGRTVSGNTASDLTWTTNGVTAPGVLAANSGSDSFSLFDTAAAQDRFAVDRNLHNEGNWFTDITFMMANDFASVSLSSVSFDSIIFNNSGNVQGVQRDLDFTVELFDDLALGPIFSYAQNNIFAANGSNSQPVKNISFDNLAVLLQQDTEYTLRITASGTGPGNNAGIDNFVLSGDVSPVPAPQAFALLALAIAGIAVRKAKRS